MESERLPSRTRPIEVHHEVVDVVLIVEFVAKPGHDVSSEDLAARVRANDELRRRVGVRRDQDWDKRRLAFKCTREPGVLTVVDCDVSDAIPVSAKESRALIGRAGNEDWEWPFVLKVNGLGARIFKQI